MLNIARNVWSTTFKNVRNLPKILRTTNRQYTNIPGASEPPMESGGELTYRIVVATQIGSGTVSWKIRTGSYVNTGEILCDITNADKRVDPIEAPVSGLIANRFVDEGMNLVQNSLLCLIKVGDPPPVIDQEQFITERSLFNELSEYEYDYDYEEDKGKPLQYKGYVRPKEEIHATEPVDEDENKKEVEQIKLSDIMDEKRKEIFEKYMPENLQEEIKRQVASEVPLAHDDVVSKMIGEHYHSLIDENFGSSVRSSLHVINNGVRDKYLTISIELNLTKAIQFALYESTRNNLKFELKYLLLTGVVNVFKDLPALVASKDQSLNITVGFVEAGKLAFPQIKNLEKLSHGDMKTKLEAIKRRLLEGQEIEEVNDRGEESLAITNEWDYGVTTGAPCLYTSPHATLSMNSIHVKKSILADVVHHIPTMTLTLAFNNDKLHGQEALLFLNRLKSTMEKMNHVSSA